MKFSGCLTGGSAVSNAPASGGDARDTGSIPGLGKWSESEVAQSCPTLCDPMDCSLPDFSVHGIFQGRVLERVAIFFSRGSSQPRDQTLVSHIAGRHFTLWATRKPWFGKIPWNRKWQSAPVFLPGESHGQRSRVGYSAWGLRVWCNWVHMNKIYWLNWLLSQMMSL